MSWLLILKQNNRLVRMIISNLLHGYLTLTDEATFTTFFLIHTNIGIHLGVVKTRGNN